MACLHWMLLILLPGAIDCYDNICERTICSATQSSTRNGLSADKVIDGNINQKEANCSHTAENRSEAWVMVDLKREYQLKNIIIFYRDEEAYSNALDAWKPYRFRNYSLEVTNSPGVQQWVQCYKERTSADEVPFRRQKIACKKTARYLRIFTTYDAPEDDPTLGAILEICEIQIYDVITCSRYCTDRQCDENGNCLQCYQGYWGNECIQRCSANCFLNNCNISGVCYNCNDGFYGDKCEKNCNPYCSGKRCHKNTGICTNRCENGFFGDYCNITCDNCSPESCYTYTGYCGTCKDGFYGENCDRQCSSTCLSSVCRKHDGYCSYGCENGFYGSFCKLECSENCMQTICSRNGTCIYGCKPNSRGDKCNKCDSIHHGTDCSQVCSVNCISQACDDETGACTLGCNKGFYLHKCEQNCSALCPLGCRRYSGECEGNCPVGKYGNQCDIACNQNCKNICSKINGSCTSGCIDGKFGADCLQTCGGGCISGCNQVDGRCSCETGWQGQHCDGCELTYYGNECEYQCSSNCLNGTCLSNNGSCIGGCKGDFIDEKCFIALAVSDTTSLPTTAIGAGFGAALFLSVFIIILVIVVRYRRQMHQNSKSDMVLYKKEHVPSSAENKLYTNIGSVSVAIEDPEEEPQIENPQEAVYYNDLSVAKDVAVSDLLTIITQKEARENEGFQKEFKSLPYGERFACDTAKTEENMLRNRFKTTFPYDHSRVILEVSKEFASDYINANYIENMEGRREFIACQGPRDNTLIDQWRMIWQEHVEYIVMLTNLIEGPKVKCHQYWPDEGKELDVNPFSVTMVEEKVYAYFIERKMILRKKRVSGSRTVVQYHYTRWPDHGTPNPLNLVVFHIHFRHKIRSTHHPIIVHCSAGIGRTGTFIALDVLSRYGKDKGKVNVIEYVKAMRKDRMTMIQNVDQYVFLYHALYEFFRRKGQYRKKDEFRGLYGDTNRINSQKQLTNEFNELVNVKPGYEPRDFKSGKKYSQLNFTKSVLPVEQYLVYLTSHVSGREPYYNAVHVSSFTRAEEFISAQFPVSGAAIDLVRLLVDHESAFLIAMNPFSEMKELQNWVEGNTGNVKLNPYTIVREEQTTLSDEIRKTNIKITKKGLNRKAHAVQIFECMNWSSDNVLPTETFNLINLLNQFSLDRKSHPNGPITVISKDGATCCGVFIAVYNAIEQLQQDDEVDISTIVQQLQCRRPEMVSSKEEYEFCYKTVSDFLNTDSVYANT